jgi:mRNA interferase RelE/StbE
VNYSIQIKSSAAKALAKIVRPDRLRIIAAIDQLQTTPMAGSALKGEFSGLRRLRVGDYRVVYEVEHDVLTVLVVRIGHRRSVYA